MSVVTSVILTMSCVEHGFEPEDGDGTRLDKLNAFLAEHGKLPLVLLSEHMIRGKHPQSLTFGGGYNHFPIEEFADEVGKIEWSLPENVVLIMQPETGPTIVWRPSPFTVEDEGSF